MLPLSFNAIPAMCRVRSFMINVGLVVMALAIILGFLEVVVAITKFNVSANVRLVPGKGITYIPHAYYRHTKEGFSDGFINSHGFRDYERTYEKRPGVFRILVLGDSYVEAFQVPLDETFTALLEKSLNGYASSTRFEVLALGQSGFGTADEYLRYMDFGAAYKPDLVILAFFTGNDFRNNSKFLDRDRIGFYFEFDREQQLVLDRSLIDAYRDSLTYPKRVFQELKTHSRLVSLIAERVYLFRRQVQDRRMEQTDGVDSACARAKCLSLFSDLNIYQHELPPQWNVAVEVTKGIILNFKKSVEASGSKFLLLVLSNAEQVHPKLASELSAQYGIAWDYDQPDRILEDFANKNDIMFLKLMPTFRKYHMETGRYLHGFGPPHAGHWNKTGHRVAADGVFKFLKERHLVSGLRSDSQ